MGLFGIILRNVDLNKKDKEKIHERIKTLSIKQSKKVKNEKQKK